MSHNEPPASAEYALDSSAIIHLAALRKDHSNIFRIQLVLTEDIDPDLLQEAADETAHRFPCIVASIAPRTFRYVIVPLGKAPQVRLDEDVLAYMGKEEIERCALRILYREKTLSVEVFHSLTDGHGASIYISTLLARYLEKRHGIHVAAGDFVLNVKEQTTEEELEDSYRKHANPPATPPNIRRVYQIPRDNVSRDRVIVSTLSYPVPELLSAAKRAGASLTTFLTAVMFESLVELQNRSVGKLEPMQIGVPANARKMFGSTTLRNFALIALPALEPHEASLPFSEICALTHERLKEQFDSEYVAHTIASYVRSQDNPAYRCLPLALKCKLTKLVHHLFGARNSCITLSNLGVFSLAEEMKPYVRSVEIVLTPRIESPYNLGVLSYENTCYLTFTRFGEDTTLIDVFTAALEKHIRETR